MTLNIRRIVTGHDQNGKAIVKIDDVASNTSSARPKLSQQLIWTTNDLPVVFNEDDEDNGARDIGVTVSGGSVFRVMEYQPGIGPRVHRTDSIDYAIVLSGEIDMEMDDTVVHLKTGDVLVQRGTIHNWINNGKVSCIIAFIMIGALGDTAIG